MPDAAPRGAEDFQIERIKSIIRPLDAACEYKKMGLTGTAARFALATGIELTKTILCRFKGPLCHKIGGDHLR